MTVLRDLIPTLRMLALWAWDVLGLVVRRMIVVLGVLFLVLVILACTRVPFDVHRWLGKGAGECHGTPEVIVVLGGSGMPSGPELLRLHRAAQLALLHSDAGVLVVHPDTADAMRQMVGELVLRGVAMDRITQVTQGENTREQVVLLARSTRLLDRSLALVTAPENMFRSVRAFRKAGFTQVCGAPAWDHAMHHDFAYAHERIGGKAWVPDVSRSTGLRYTFWNYVKLEVTCLREFLAIGYYRLNGWI